ncbi:uncharacterized protein LOC101847347 [Aplysia californica]|uniref:Uncharacterized protein LOC101847347 n=1 Tax=Aplysia californica TaxID=6500 RepID=A0ABM0JR76_APLCA|nr:uncharacterized protein LOC101847347 [Aplysia californica]
MNFNVDCMAEKGEILGHILPRNRYEITKFQDTSLLKFTPYRLNTSDNTIYLRDKLNDSVSNLTFLYFTAFEKQGYWEGNYSVTINITGRHNGVCAKPQASFHQAQAAAQEERADNLVTALIVVTLLFCSIIAVLVTAFIR